MTSRITARFRAAGWSLATVLSVTGCLAGPTGMGTRGEPTPVGVPARVGSYEVAVGPTLTDAAALVLAEDQANAPPPEAPKYVLVPIRLTYDGSSEGEPWLDLTVRFVAEDGGLFGEYERDQCGAIPGSMEYIDEMPPGTSRLGTVCVSVPEDKVEGGSWVMREDASWGWRGFFEADTREIAVPGSRLHPTAPGSEAEVGPYSISMGPTTSDEDAASTRVGPAPGRHLVLAPVNATFHGGRSSGDPWTDLSFEFLAADGSSYGRNAQDSCGEIPNPIEYVGPLAPDVPATGAICVSVPADRIESGTWHVTEEGTALDWLGHFSLSE